MRKRCNAGTSLGHELKVRSLLDLVILTALGKWTELGTHVMAAVKNGASEAEIREALLQAVYPLSSLFFLFWIWGVKGKEGRRACWRGRLFGVGTIG